MPAHGMFLEKTSKLILKISASFMRLFPDLFIDFPVQVSNLRTKCFERIPVPFGRESQKRLMILKENPCWNLML